jgi:hypothetical protein
MQAVQAQRVTVLFLFVMCTTTLCDVTHIGPVGADSRHASWQEQKPVMLYIS